MPCLTSCGEPIVLAESVIPTPDAPVASDLAGRLEAALNRVEAGVAARATATAEADRRHAVLKAAASEAVAALDAIVGDA